MEGEIAPALAGAVGDPAAVHQHRGVDRAAREDHRRGSYPQAPAATDSDDHTAGAIALHEDLAHVRACEDLRSGRLRTRDVGDAGVLLGGGGAAERAHA